MRVEIQDEIIFKWRERSFAAEEKTAAIYNLFSFGVLLDFFRF